MFLKIPEYIRKQGVASTQQLSREFRLDFSALQPMLAFWTRKGLIKKCDTQSTCRTACFSCKTNQLEYYQYIGAEL